MRYNRLHSSARPWSGCCVTFVVLAALGTTGFCAPPTASPTGFVPLFNGKDLSGWQGGETFDPRILQSMPDAERETKIRGWTQSMQRHWSVRDGELISDGEGSYATTVKEYGDFELVAEYRTVPRADSGIYLRGCPQVQIWDWTDTNKFALGADKGSGGLWNNSPGAPGKDPLVLADLPFGEWNFVRVMMVGEHVSVWLNRKLVVDDARLENYFDRSMPVPPRGPIQLQTHGGEIRWRKLFVREIRSAEANQRLRNYGPVGFKSVFNGTNFDGWAGPLDCCRIQNGAIVWQPNKGGTIYTKAEYSDFIVRLESKLPRGGNNGLAIRYPGTGDTAYVGMCELQVLDDHYEQATGDRIDPRQADGSAYGMVAAARGYQRPIGEWNYEEATVRGSTLKVELNGTVILNCDVSGVTNYMDGKAHPGKNRKTGHFGFAGHNDPVAFRNIEIKRFE